MNLHKQARFIFHLIGPRVTRIEKKKISAASFAFLIFAHIKRFLKQPTAVCCIYSISFRSSPMAIVLFWTFIREPFRFEKFQLLMDHGRLVNLLKSRFFFVFLWRQSFRPSIIRSIEFHFSYVLKIRDEYRICLKLGWCDLITIIF